MVRSYKKKVNGKIIHVRAHKRKNSNRLGSGRRFSVLEKKLKREGRCSDCSALAAYIGRKKYGDKRFSRLSRRGKR